MFEPVLFVIIVKIGSKRTPFTNIMSQASSLTKQAMAPFGEITTSMTNHDI